MITDDIYTVHAYRWGDRESHNYSVGVYRFKEEALAAAEAESEYRGGKYECEVLRWDAPLNVTPKNHRQDSTVVKALP